MMTTEKPITSFVELIQPLTEFDQKNRVIIDSTVSAAHSREEFVNNWQQLSIQLVDGSIISTTAREVGERALCQLEVATEAGVGLKLQVWVRSAPRYPQDVSQSLIRLYHTKVITYKIPNFRAFQYYDALMYLLRKLAPTETKLLLYVRQKDSREQLEQGISPRKTPLARVFQRAGWKFLGYTKDRVVKDPLRVHRLTLVS